MNIRDLFEKDIHRNINGVIKVGQQDSESIRQELDEYVVTQELDRHFSTFFDRYTDSLDQPTDKMGVWISGFFGSGKSHFLKILSYLLDNVLVGERKAIEFFDEKRIHDPLLRASMARSVEGSTDVILFNIDSKADADSKNKKDSIVRVFQKVFDDHLGYFGTNPAIAEFERQLDQKGQYQSFMQAFEEASGLVWQENRDGWLFHQDDISAALTASTGMSLEWANRLVESLEASHTNSVEEFAKMVGKYLDSKGLKHRLIFMVDEVGQYIGDNPDLMLNLQTVVEDLGIHCRGRAWVIVTSQEAIDEITKMNRIRSGDFSKIVGRFNKPLSLSSTNTDEVIKLRLLDKTEVARSYLESLYGEKQAILKNQINFTGCADLPGYKDAKEFQLAYPFIPYQFNLLQSAFTQIRIIGSAGKHLASGERSLLDAFQISAKTVAEQPIGTLIPFHTFYKAIEGFLDSSISQVVNQAAKNSQLEAFDIDLLKVLYMVKYVKEVTTSPDNLTTLCLTNIDQDRVLLKNQVQESLQRLEKQTLIQRTGDNYSFLTHEEQDIGREIKNIEIDPSEVTAEFQRMVWDSLFTDKKFKYSNRHQYDFNRKLDYQAKGSQASDFGLHVITPYCDRYNELQNDDLKCIAETADGKEVLVRLPEDVLLIDEAYELVRTDKYIRRKNSGNLTASIRKILDSRADENSKRRERVELILRGLIERADVFAVQSNVSVSSRDVKTLLTEGLNYLVSNVYQKLGYVESGFSSDDEIAKALTRNFETINIDGEYPNGAAHQEMQSWLTDEAGVNRRVNIRNLVDRFSKRPFGWSEFDVLGVLAELVNLGKVELRLAQATVNSKEVGLVAKLRSKTGLDSYLVRLCGAVDAASLQVARDLARDLLTGTAPGDTAKLYEAYQGALQVSCDRLQGWIDRSKSEQLPFGEMMQGHLKLLQNLAAQDGAAAFFGAMRSQRDDLEDYVEDDQKIQSFFEGQLPVFLKARQDLKVLEPELCHVSEPEAIAKVARVREILGMADPTSQVPQLGVLLQPVQALVKSGLQAQREKVVARSEVLREKVGKYAGEAHPEVAAQLDMLRLTQPIESLMTAVGQAQSIDSAIARQSELERLEGQLLQQVDEAAAGLLAQQQVPGAELPVTKPMVTMRLSQIGGKSILESAQDVDEYLGRVKLAIAAEIDQGKRVRLE
jgi:hypothetical protein